MNAKDLRTKTEQELKEQLKGLLKELRENSIAVMKQDEKHVGKPRQIRKDIARVKTLMKEKEILQNAEVSGEKDKI